MRTHLTRTMRTPYQNNEDTLPGKEKDDILNVAAEDVYQVFNDNQEKTTLYLSDDNLCHTNCDIVPH